MDYLFTEVIKHYHCVPSQVESISLNKILFTSITQLYSSL